MQRIIGVETEYAIHAIGPDQQPIDRDVLARSLIGLAHERLMAIPDELSNGLYLGNGARFYIDAGAHPEFTTPECANPWDAVRYIRAGELILDYLTDQMENSIGSEVEIFRCQVDYSGSGATWGRHESYLCRDTTSNIRKCLVPHLVSRIVFTGAGGFDNRAAGAEFILSPRVPHLRREVSGDSTGERGIYHTRDESLAQGAYRRLHLICGESLCSDLATWLKLGTTALVVAMIEAGVCDARSVELRDSVSAMRTIAGDDTLREVVATSAGRALRATDIQRHYLRLAESCLQHSFMPRWAGEVCAKWREVLDALECGPAEVATRLDWAIKRALFRRRVERFGMKWSQLEAWNRVAGHLARGLRFRGGRSVLDAELSRSTHPALVAARDKAAGTMRRHGLSWSDFPSYLTLRSQLLEIDMRFGQLGPHGLFARLDVEGVIQHRVAGVDDIDGAAAEPPDQPRAQARGKLVRRLGEKRGRRCSADWQMVWDHESGTCFDLSDPFGAEVAIDRAEARRMATGAGGSRLLAMQRTLQERLRRMAGEVTASRGARPATNAG